jgi:hypothetical protein
MTDVRYVEAKYDTTIMWDIERIAESEGFELEDIEKVEVGKWVELHITLRDGTFISKQITPELDNTDWKWSSMDSYLDEDWNPIDEDELFPDTYIEEEVNG